MTHVHIQFVNLYVTYETWCRNSQLNNPQCIIWNRYYHVHNKSKTLHFTCSAHTICVMQCTIWIIWIHNFEIRTLAWLITLSCQWTMIQVLCNIKLAICNMLFCNVLISVYDHNICEIGNISSILSYEIWALHDVVP